MVERREGPVVENFGISRGGRSAEDAFIALTGAQRATTAAEGDAVLDGSPVEVKRATGNTLNQVRAVKYIPLAVYYVPADTWYVVPAHVVVAAVSQRRRGQHTENPFESATLSVKSLAAYEVTDVRDLRSRTLEAIAKSDEYPEIKELMDAILHESKDLAASSIDRARRLLHDLGLGT